MNAAQLLAHFDRLAEAPGAVPRLRRFILDLAVRGKLVEQDSAEEPARRQLADIGAARALRVGDSKPRQRKVVTQNDVSDLPFPLSSGWSMATLAELTDVLNGRAYAKNELLDTGTPVLRVGNLFTSKHWYYSNLNLDQDKYCDNGDLIFSWSASFGPFIWNGPKVIYHYHIWKLPLHSETRLDKHYLYRFLLQQTQQIKDSGHGVSMIHMTKEKMEKLLVPVPPLAEQHRIVAKVDELMALCDQLEAAQQERERRRDRLAAASLQRLNQPAEANSAADQTESTETHQQAQREQQKDHAHFHLQNLHRLTTRPEHIKAMRQTFLNLAVRGLLVSQRTQDEPAAAILEAIQLNKAQLVRSGAIPKEKAVAATASVTFPLPSLWAAVRLGEICNLVTSGSRGWAEFYAKSGPKFLRAQNIRFGRLRLDELACVNPPAKSEGARTQLQPGDLLIVITGAGVTNPALLDHDLGEAYVSQHVALVRPSSTTLSKWLLLCLMAGPSGRDELVERAYGAGKPGLNLDNIRSLNTPLPPLAEQHRIVAKVDELMALCDQLEAQLTQSQTDSRRLLEAVLDAALAPA